MIILGIPVINNKELTQQVIDSLVATVNDPENFMLILIDNGSEQVYRLTDYILPFKSMLFINEENKGYYYPLMQIYSQFPEKENLIGLCHNDLIFYEKGWDTRLRQYFAQDPKLGLVGFCGSNEVDENGGRGGGTMCYFRGEKGQPQSAGRRITGLEPALILDSLFMMFKSEAIPGLNITQDIPLCHFYDKLWGIRTVENGFHVAVMGSEVDHLGGMTAIGQAPSYSEACKKWLTKRGIPYGSDGTLEMYQVAERHFLGEYRDQKHIFPARVDAGYNVWKK